MCAVDGFLLPAACLAAFLLWQVIKVISVLRRGRRHTQADGDMRFSSGSCSLARAWPWENQDACFTAERHFGVFDGVSAASNSRKYAQQLAAVTKQALTQADREGYGDYAWPGQAQAVLREAVAAASRVDGAATACLLRLDSDRRSAAVYNLGDSGFLLLSPTGDDSFRVSATSAPRTHSDGSPFQLAGASLISDSPSSGTAATHALLPGQVAILHTDGLLDNIDVRDVASIVTSTHRAGSAALATALAQAARRAGRVSDDITVVAISIADST